MRIVRAKIAGKKDFIDWIRREKNCELDVVLLEFAGDAEHDGFLRQRRLAASEWRDSVIVTSFFIRFDWKRGFSVGELYGVLRLSSEFFLVSRSKERNLTRKVEVNDFAFVSAVRNFTGLFTR